MRAVETMSVFTEGTIADLIIRDLARYQDERGWLAELYRFDELPAEFHPQMAYLSVTKPGIARGPHEHAEQADLFAFLGPSNFMLYLWDNRPSSATYRNRQRLLVGEERPAMVVVPKGVVHAYKNVGTVPGTVINCANRLYRGPGRRERVDEIRHEHDPHTIFILD